jgi:hypothetical protein
MKTNLETKLNFNSESELARYCEEYMQRKNEYNGWSNYATWRVALEMVDGASYEYKECERKYKDISELAEDIKSNCESYLDDEVGGYTRGLSNDYAHAFLSDVKWYEIAENIASGYNIIITDNIPF